MAELPSAPWQEAQHWLLAGVALKMASPLAEVGLGRLGRRRGGRRWRPARRPRSWHDTGGGRGQQGSAAAGVSERLHIGGLVCMAQNLAILQWPPRSPQAQQ